MIPSNKFLPLLICLLLFPGLCFAQNCEVGVRVIKGSEKEAKEIDLGSMKSLVGMKDQLENLPYKKYDVMTTRSQQVPLGVEGKFRVPDAMGKSHLVKVQPVSIKDKMVEVLVNWHGSDASKLLSTKLRVLNGKKMMLGTDSSREHSTILSIQVSCPV